ncbi:MAG: Holliday junction branch migration protein RuvA [Gemmatimonadota bacterium]|nr:Holliday junction branch migration protein RuvA [Candidatus Palauibacterales bacterium]
MISRLTGKLLSKEIDRAEVATVGGVTYELQIPAMVFEALPRVGEEVELHTALLGRDDGLDLYGFSSERERRLFLRLQSASGVGPRLALALLGAMSAERLVEAIRGRDLVQLQMVSGVGKKKAERIALELGDKLEDMIAPASREEPRSALVESAVSALVSLGYTRGEAESAVRDVLKSRDGKTTEVEALVRQALTAL